MLKNKKESHSSIKSDALRILGDSSPFSVKEAFRAIYSNIIYLPIEDKCKKIAITSACTGEGKTFVSINLAITIAQSLESARVLLIDGDMRSPRIEKLLGLGTHSHGISEFLAGLDKSPNFCDTKIPNLKVLYAGARSANPARLINTDKMDELFSICNESFDFVIIDTPPINLVSDALLLSKRINSYFLVARGDYSDIKTMSFAVDTLNQVEAEIGGIILCNINPKHISSKFGSYGSHKRYGRFKKYMTYYYDGNGN